MAPQLMEGSGVDIGEMARFYTGDEDKLNKRLQRMFGADLRSSRRERKVGQRSLLPASTALDG